MEARSNPHSGSRGERRPYRSHLHPACFSCKKRKSRCSTASPGGVCMMCQAHGTECSFPQADSVYQRRSSSPRELPAGRRHRISRSGHDLRRRILSSPQAPVQPIHGTTAPMDPVTPVSTTVGGSTAVSSTPVRGDRAEGLSHLTGIVTEADDDSSHIVSPAIADENDIVESYLSAVSNTRNRCLIGTSTTSSRPLRPVRFNVVPRRPLGVTANQSLAVSKCEIIEKYIEPDIDEVVNLFFSKANICFPIFDEASFRSAFISQKPKISPALLCNLYANSLIYWRSSSKLSSGRTPDIRYIWNQANEASHSELFLSPGISTVISIIMNVCGRPSTSVFGNGGMVGTAVALSNALGLNRDPSDWNISPLEKSLRIRVWWLVVLQDRWCSLAYGTPLQVHRAQYDVPFPSIEDISSTNTPPYEKGAASVFVALTTLTDVLGRFLEYVYSVSRSHPHLSEVSSSDLEQILSQWEDSLDDDIRRIVLRGTHLDIPGAANFRLAYLAVKLLLRRIQLDLNKGSTQAEDATASPFYTHAQRAAEEIVHLVQELDEAQFLDFWIPHHAFSLTSATMFLLRSGLHRRNQNRNTPLKIARDMINTLWTHHNKYEWDLADDCLNRCSELVEKIGITEGDSQFSAPELPDFSPSLDIDPSVLEELFSSIPGFTGGVEI